MNNGAVGLVVIGLIRFAALAIWVLATAACVTSPTGRQQFAVLPESVVTQFGVTAFDDIKRTTAEVSDGFLSAYVTCVADSIVRELPGPERERAWEVVVFRADSANAFALPGGKIGVHEGLLDVAKNQDQLAAVLGHEIAHVIARHANERLSTTLAADAGLRVLQGTLGNSAQKAKILGLLGAGAQYGVLLPYNRQREAEADVIGLRYMATAGFDPAASVDLWRNMAAANPNSPPEFLSTHPSHGTRISGLQGLLPEMRPLFVRARSAGYRPDCDRLRGSLKK